MAILTEDEVVEINILVIIIGIVAFIGSILNALKVSYF